MKTKKLFPVLLVVIGISIGFSVSYFGSFSRHNAVGITATKPLFQIDGVDYYESDLSEKMRLDLYRLRNENFMRESYAVKAYALRILLAKQNNVPMISAEPPLLEKLIPLPKISDQDIDAFFHQTNAEFPKDADKALIYEKIKVGLAFNKFTEVLRENLQKNKRNEKLAFYLTLPELPDVEFTQFGSYPIIGDVTSTNELLVMTPFFCKTCTNIHNAVKNAVTRFPIKARIIYTYEKKDSSDYVWSHTLYCLNQVSESAFKEFYSRYNYNFTVNENPMTKLQTMLQDQILEWNAIYGCLNKDNEFNRESQLNSLGVVGANALIFNGKMLEFEDDLNDVLSKKFKNK